jgi:hypothetical protein
VSRPRRDDTFFAADLARVMPVPVFIIGLARSGTTFLYQMLADAFPVAVLTVHHVVNYDTILLHHHEGTTEAAGRELDAMFRGWNMPTRRIDEFPLSHAMPEEYCWVLRRRGGAFHVTGRSAPRLEEICRKLHCAAPSAEAVVLKNPRDTGRVDRLLAHFPRARFVFLQRDPVAVVNSQFRVAKYHGREQDPYLELLLGGIPLARAWMRAQRILRKVLGESLFCRIALAHILRDVGRELGRLQASWKLVPPHRRVALDYDCLVRDPERAIEKLATSLGLSPRSDRVRVDPRPRDPTLLPEVAAAAAGFRGRLHERGIALGPLDGVATG